MKFFVALVSILFLSTSAIAADVGSAAPTFTIDAIKNVTAAKINLSDYKGKVVYVDFWASWCGPCKRSLPKLEELRSKYKDKGFEVIAINMDENVQDALAFLDKFPVSYPIGADAKGVVAEQYHIKGLPSAYIIDRRGVISHIVVGFDEKTEFDTIESVTTKLLGSQ